jgi:hypothetical protein
MIAEYDRAQLLTIDRQIVLQDIVPEDTHDLPPRLRARYDNLSTEQIAVYAVCAEIHKVLEHKTLAACLAPGQTYDTHCC